MSKREIVENQMTNLEKISSVQTILLLGICRIAIVMLWFKFSNQDVWITEIVALFYIAIIGAPLLLLGKRFASLTPVEYFSLITGKLIGKILGALYAAFFLFIAIMDLALFDNVLRPINFPETPDYAIIFLALATCAYAVNKGLECIARAAEIFVPIIIIEFILYTILLIPEMDFKVFLPVLADSTFWEINSQAFNTAGRMNELVAFSMLVPSIDKKADINRIFFWVAILITAFSLVIIVPTLAGLGLDVPKKTFDPYYLFVKQINIYDFITRIEFFLVGAWNVGMFLKISLLMYLTTICLVQAFGLPKRKILILPMVIVVFIITMTTDILKSVIVFSIMDYLPYINLIFMFAIPAAMVVILFMRRVLNIKSGYNS
jgi:spore germination protein KB